MVGLARRYRCALSDTSAVSADGTTAAGTLSGTVAGGAVGSLVNWKAEFASVTAWTGLILSDGVSPAIYSVWHLGNTPAADEDVWESILAGSDLFIST